ncbi:MAG: hypothetical protein J6T04_02240 [Bacteroidales bacterium]|nr:hypothetical protein [Bacteroidales bacterium]
MTTIAIITISGLALFFVFWLIDGFDFEETTEKWYADIFGGIGLLGLLYYLIKYLIKGVVWLAKAIWAIISSKVFLIVVGSIVFIAAVTFFIIYLRKRYLYKKFRSAENRIREVAHIPLSLGAVNSKNVKYANQATSELSLLMDRLGQATDKKDKSMLKNEIFNKRLLLFYNVSLPFEAHNDKVYSKFAKKAFSAENNGDFYNLRKDENETKILANDELMYSKELQTFKEQLDTNKIEEIIKGFNDVKDYDPSYLFGLITSASGMKRKTKIMKELYDASIFEFNELEDIREKVNYILSYTRVCAYRNIYLGAELLNFIRDNAGGKNLVSQGDLITLDLNFNNVEYSKGDLSVNLSDIVFSNAASYIDEVFSSESNIKYVVDNPKAALAEVALNIIGDYLQKRAEVIEKNREIQKSILENFEKLIDAYNVGQAVMYRGLEIIKALVKANKGFLTIYAPLRDKVFKTSEFSTICLKDIQLLAQAVKEYNNISKANLKN